MNKKNKKNNELPIFYIIMSIIVIILLMTNIILLNKYFNVDKEITETIYYNEIEGEYDKLQKYYATVSYNSFKKLYKSNEISTIAIIDESTKTTNKFIELINKIAFYKNTKIYILEINKLSRKNEIAFYNLDERLSKLNGNYIIAVSNSKILSVTTFEQEEINTIIERLGE